MFPIQLPKPIYYGPFRLFSFFFFFLLMFHLFSIVQIVECRILRYRVLMIQRTVEIRQIVEFDVFSLNVSWNGLVRVRAAGELFLGEFKCVRGDSDAY